jgi:glucose-6-phosphate 1-dehydrogenase
MLNRNDEHVSVSTAAPSFTSNTEKDLKFCMAEKRPDPCILVIIGASGDLTARKIIPAIHNLHITKSLPLRFVTLGCARSKLDSQGFRERIKNSPLNNLQQDRAAWSKFSSSLFYSPVDYNDLSSFIELKKSLDELDRENRIGGNRIFYLAIPPSLYRQTAQMLGQAGLADEQEGNWVRLVVEKPFGRDLETAVDLDRVIHEHFQEHQVFRIDHYLAKETVQNILMFRFANSIFEPVWNRQYIDHVTIKAAETLGVEHRAGYYEQAGVLRDMFQNHMMQLLALTAMEPPSIFEPDRVRDEKTKVYRSLKPFSADRIEEYLMLGQYIKGTIHGKAVPGYRDEPGVSPDSSVPTFAMMKLFLDNWRWQGVPFYLMSGKRLSSKVTEIQIQFKEVPHSVFRRTLGEHISANSLILGIYPEERITLTFQTKQPGTRVCLRPVTMDFHYRQDDDGPVLDSYEKVLVDCMLGDHMLFWRQDGVDLCWSFLTPILEKCETCSDKDGLLKKYPAGAWGTDNIERIWQEKG